VAPSPSMGPRPVVVTVVLLALCCLAQCTPSWQPSSFPNPGSDARACGRGDVKAGASRICDPDHVIGSESRNVVEGIIQDIEAGREPYATMDCGAKGKTGYKVCVAAGLQQQRHV
jgi:Modulator of levamisole receptor-1